MITNKLQLYQATQILQDKNIKIVFTTQQN